MITMPMGQAIAGYRVGVIYIEDVWYPLVPGNVVNASTFDFPVRLAPVHISIPSLFGTDSVDVFDAVMEACLQLKREGVWAISSACGFFGKYQARVREALGMPVALSSLVQIPWIRALVPGRIGVLTADSSSFDAELLAACGVFDSSELEVAGLQDAPEFSAILEGRGSFDNDVVRQEVVDAALSLDLDGVGAILLECSDMPPYASAIQQATGKPVFDFTTLIRYLHTAVAQRAYSGFI
ncbi:MAG: aspartate/glutamate racemase family protein [Propionibacteriaceae bacterium]|jgi:Asp/Glu/hydantoin racemase|nr:aspartate/glutamate racemase family protein [Propionibacteriaceae bacterium]